MLSTLCQSTGLHHAAPDLLNDLIDLPLKSPLINGLYSASTMHLVTGNNAFVSMRSVSQAYSTSENVTHISRMPSKILNMVCPSRTHSIGHVIGDENNDTTSNAPSTVGDTPNSNNTAVNPRPLVLYDAVTKSDSSPQNCNAIVGDHECYDSDDTEVQQELDISTPVPTQPDTTTQDNLFSNTSVLCKNTWARTSHLVPQSTRRQYYVLCLSFFTTKINHTQSTTPIACNRQLGPSKKGEMFCLISI